MSVVIGMCDALLSGSETADDRSDVAQLQATFTTTFLGRVTTWSLGRKASMRL